MSPVVARDLAARGPDTLELDHEAKE
jgi:hypothetical protein